MAEVLRIRRLYTMVYRVIRAKRDDVACGVDEYFDSVVGHCSLCSDICLPQRGTLNVCAVNCPSFYRRMTEDQRQQQQQQQNDQLSPDDVVGQASAFPDLNVVIPVIVLFAVLFLASVVLSVMFYRRHRQSFCTKSPKDECTETDFRGSALESGGNAAEMERLNVDLERDCLDLLDRFIFHLHLERKRPCRLSAQQKPI